MPAQPLTAGLPPDLVLQAGYVIRLVALAPASGTPVAGVRLSNVSIFVQNVGGGDASELQSGPFMLVPGPSAA